MTDTWGRRVELKPFKSLFPAQHRIQRIIDDHRRAGRRCKLLILKARRHGISTLIEANLLHGVLFNEHVKALIVAHNGTTTTEIYGMLQNFFGNLDDWMKPMVQRSNRKEFIFQNPDPESRAELPGLDSGILVQCAEGAAKKTTGAGQLAAGLARGTAISFLHWSEVAFCPNADELEQGFGATFTLTDDALQVLEFTANGQAGLAYEEWQRAEAGESSYQHVFIPWFEHPHYKASHIATRLPEWAPKERESRLYEEYIGCLMLPGLQSKAEQIADVLKLDEEERDISREFGIQGHLDWDRMQWRRYCLQDVCGHDATKLHVEYPIKPEEAFTASGTPRFDSEKIRKHFMPLCCDGVTKRIVVDPKDYDPLTQGRIQPTLFLEDSKSIYEPLLEVWEEPIPGHHYIVSVDIAEGVKQDFTVIKVLHRNRKKFVAKMKSNTMKGKETAANAILISWLYNKAILAPESNLIGRYVCGKVEESGYPNAYFRERLVDGRPEKECGFETMSSTRPKLIMSLDEDIKHEEVEDPSVGFWNEARTFVRNPESGKDDHLRGCFSDELFSGAIALYINKLLPSEIDREVAAPTRKRDFVWGGGYRVPEVTLEEELRQRGQGARSIAKFYL